MESAQGSNASLYNGMIAPWLPTAVRGAIFYQVTHTRQNLPMSSLAKSFSFPSTMGTKPVLERNCDAWIND